MTYTPLPGSIADRAIGHICQLPKGTEIAAAPLAEAIECDPSSIPACLTSAVAAGILALRKHERLSYYSKGNGKPLAGKAPLAAQDDPDDPVDPPITQRQVQANGAEPLAVPPAARSVFDGHGALASMQGVAAKARPTPAAKPRPAGKGTRVYTAKKGKPAVATPRPRPAAPKVKAQRVPFAMAVAPAPIASIAPSAIAPPPPPPPLACALFNTGDLVIEAPDQPALRLTRPQARELVNYLQHIEAALQQST